MSFYYLIVLWRQLIEIRALRTWKIFCQYLGDFLLFSNDTTIVFQNNTLIMERLLFPGWNIRSYVFQNFFWSDCLSLQILEKWSLTLFLLMLTALLLSWQYFSQSSGFLDLLNCLLQRLRSLITSRKSGFINWNWSRCFRRNDLTGARSSRTSTNNFSQAQYTSSGPSKT